MEREREREREMEKLFLYYLLPLIYSVYDVKRFLSCFHDTARMI